MTNAEDRRTVRVPEVEWREAKAAAALDGVSISEVVRSALRHYVVNVRAGDAAERFSRSAEGRELWSNCESSGDWSPYVVAAIRAETAAYKPLREA